MNKENIFSICVKFAAVLLLLEVVMLFFVDIPSAEFYVLLFSMILMIGIIVFAVIKIRMNIKHEKE